MHTYRILRDIARAYERVIYLGYVYVYEVLRLLFTAGFAFARVLQLHEATKVNEQVSVN